MPLAVTILETKFFSRSVLNVAPDLLGKYLVTPDFAGLINEVEAYDGPEDLACHGRFGPTKRTEVMFGPAGRWYVYMIYGMYFMLNIVTGDQGYPSAVLIRGVGQFNGPGKLTKALGIDRSFNGLSADKSSGLWIEDRGDMIDRKLIKRTPRIGVEYAGRWAKKPYRFVIRDS